MIIKNSSSENIDKIMNIWLDTNIKAHDFIDRQYWKNFYEYVRDALPSADIYLYQEDSIIKGFIGVQESKYIAGLFVLSDWQSQGIGQKLLEHCKAIYEKLELEVFIENKRAVKFYEKNNFEAKGIKMNQDFGHEEYHMTWKK